MINAKNNKVKTGTIYNALIMIMLSVTILFGAYLYSDSISNKLISQDVRINNATYESINNLLQLKNDTFQLHSKIQLQINDLYNNKISQSEFLETYNLLSAQLKILVQQTNSDKSAYNKEIMLIKKDIKDLQLHYEAIYNFIHRQIRASDTIDSKMLYYKTLLPSVRIRVFIQRSFLNRDTNEREWGKPIGFCSGSGTITYSDINTSSGKAETYILSCGHLMDDLMDDLMDEKTLEPLSQFMRLSHLEVDIFNYLGSKIVKKASVIAFSNADTKYDLSVLKLEDDENTYTSASFISKKDIAGLEIFTPILNVGSGSGLRAYPSFGIITALYTEFDRGKLNRLWQVSTPGCPGNSGCGIFTRDDGILFGVLVRGMKSHQVFVVNPYMIWEWCKDNKLEFVLHGFRTVKGKNYEEKIIKKAG